MNKKYIRVSDKELNGSHKCAVCDISQMCMCNLSYQEEHNMGNCNEGYYYREVKK